MAAAFSDITVPNTLTPVIGLSQVEGRAMLFIRNLAGVAVNVEVYYYPDGVIAVRDNTLVPDLSSIPAGTTKLIELPLTRPDQLSVSASAASSTARLQVTLLQPSVRRTRTRMGL